MGFYEAAVSHKERITHGANLRAVSMGRCAAKAHLFPLAVLPWVIYLALPTSVHRLLIILPVSGRLAPSQRELNLRS